MLRTEIRVKISTSKKRNVGAKELELHEGAAGVPEKRRLWGPRASRSRGRRPRARVFGPQL